MPSSDNSQLNIKVFGSASAIIIALLIYTAAFNLIQFLKVAKICSRGRQEVLYILLESPDAEVYVFGARRHMCLMCAHVAHQAHRQFFVNSKIFQTIFQNLFLPTIDRELSHFDHMLV